MIVASVSSIFRVRSRTRALPKTSGTARTRWSACGAQSRTSVGAPALQGSTDGARESFTACVGVQHRLVRLPLTRRRPLRGMGEHRSVLRALPGRGSAAAPYGAHPSHRVALVSTPLAGTIWAAGHSPPVPERAQLLLTLGHLHVAGSGLEQRTWRKRFTLTLRPSVSHCFKEASAHKPRGPFELLLWVMEGHLSGSILKGCCPRGSASGTPSPQALHRFVLHVQP